MDLINIVLAGSPPKVSPGDIIWQYLQVLIDTEELEDIEEKRVPLNISLVIDRSGSMAGDAMRYARDAAVEFVNNLSKNDIISVIAYDDQIDTIVVPTQVKNLKSSITDSIRQLEARGSTDLHGAVVKGIEEVEKNLQNNYMNRVILLSDGQANVGLLDIIDINKDLQKRIKNKPISVSTLGLGADFNEILLEGLSSQFKGNYYYIEESNFIPRLVSRELTGLLSLLWKNLEISFEASSQISIKEVLGYTPKDFSTYIGEVRSLDELYVICKYPIPSDLTAGQEIKVILRYDNVVNKQDKQEQVFNFPIEISTEKTDLEEDIAIITNLELYAMGNDIESARQKMEAGDYTTATEVIEKRITIMKDLSDKQPGDERLGVKLKFLELMLSRSKSGAYNKKFGKMSSYYSYSSLKSRYRMKSQRKYSPDPNQNQK